MENPSSAPGLREQIGAAIAAFKRLARAHVELARSELGEIMDEVKRVAMLAGVAIGVVVLAAMLAGVGLILFLGEWIFGSIGWGVLLGTLLFVDIAVVAVLLALGVSGGALGRDGVLALVLGVVVGVVLGLDLTNRGWTALGDSLMPGVGAATRPLVTGVLVLAIGGAVIGLVAGLRSGGGAAVGGLFGGAIAGALLGVLTAVALGPRVGAAFGVLTALIAWPAFSGIRVARTGIDFDALMAKFIPRQTIDTTKETIEWARARMPLGRKS